MTGRSLLLIGSACVLLICGAAPRPCASQDGSQNGAPETLESFAILPWDFHDGFGPKDTAVLKATTYRNIDDYLERGSRAYEPFDSGFAGIAECGYNFSGFVSGPDGIEASRKNGLKCVVYPKIDMFDSRGLSDEQLAVKCAEMEAAFKKVVEETKDDPCVWGYCLSDEPGPWYNLSMAAASAAIRKNAPGKFVYVNLFPNTAPTTEEVGDRSPYGAKSYKEFLERFIREVKPDVLSYDNYEVEYSDDLRNPNRGIAHFTNLFEIRAAALEHGIPFWFVGSGVSLRSYSSPPSYARLALQTYTALAAGARGITWYHYYPVGRDASAVDSRGARTVYWDYMKTVNGEARALGNYLESFRSTEVGTTDLWPNVEPKLPPVPNNVLVNLKSELSRQGGYSDADAAREIKLMVGEFAGGPDGNRVAALAVNLNVGVSVRVKFDSPAGYGPPKTVSPVSGREEDPAPEELEEGFWILPGCGKLFVFERAK